MNAERKRWQMIIKKRMKPRILQKYEVLQRRLRGDFPGITQIEREYIKYMKGYTGEVKVDYYLEPLAQMYTMLKDVCLDVHGQTVQMDNLIITPHAIYIIEVKNYSGKIIFDTTLDQFTRNDGHKETGFSHPITQVEFQQLKLQNWLQSQGFPDIPIYYFVAISEPSTVINVVGNHEYIAGIVTQGEQITKKILNREKQFENSTNVTHQKIGYAILRACREFDKDILAEHGIKLTDLVSGVSCTNCGRIGMERKHRNWHCPTCSHKDQHAHLPAINDYVLLINPSITNRECRSFLHINSRHITLGMLRNTSLEYDNVSRRWTSN